ncbi:MAG TPA: TonB-dependent receptor [Steroidobacteraceae bacterium]|jgi:iron complex outermembrane receptor protein|nr:TonB-dependent receptor [Steroidobacteraceae bacterium]
MNTELRVSCVLGLLAALGAAPAIAQTSDALQEIVVTAEKRASTVQDTPISMTAVSGDLMRAQGIANLSDVILAVPGISMRTAGPGQTELEMRGLSSSGGASPTVGFYLDDYPLSPPAAALNGKVVVDPDLYDLNRVEVLRGPQGTLYGSGSMGGTVKLVTNAPNLSQFGSTAEALASGTVGGGFNRGGNLMLNVPLVDNQLALRVVATDKFTDGWISRYVLGNQFPFPTNPGPCGPGWPGCTRGDVTAVTPQEVVPRINWERLEGVRANLLWQPSDSLKVSALAMYQEINMGDYSQYDLPPGIPDARYEPFNASEPIYDIFHLVGLTITYDMGFAQLTSASSYYTREENQTQDDSEALYSVVGLFGASIPGYLDIPFNETDSTRVFSEEARLASTGEGPFQWIAGLFYTDFESIFTEYNASVPLAFISTGGAAANPLGIIYQADNPYHIKQYAVFGEGTWSFNDFWKFTAGLRWYRFNSRADEETAGFGTASGNAAQTLNTFTASNTGVNPKFTLSYEANHQLTAYATIARGFRPGGINQQIPNICSISTETYGPDNTWNYEIGEKAKLLDNHLVLNADFYYTRWEQVQQIVNQTCGYPLTENAGTAETYGPEVEVTWLLTPQWSLTASGAYTHAAITSVNAAISAVDPTLAPGLPILNIPKYTETTSLTYTRPAFDGIDFTARLSNSYVGEMTDIEYTYATLPSYDLIALRLGLSSGQKWSAYLFGDNLTDKRAQLGINTTAFAWTIPSVERVVTNQPRTIGVDFNYRF